MQALEPDVLTDMQMAELLALAPVRSGATAARTFVVADKGVAVVADVYDSVSDNFVITTIADNGNEAPPSVATATFTKQAQVADESPYDMYCRAESDVPKQISESCLESARTIGELGPMACEGVNDDTARQRCRSGATVATALAYLSCLLSGAAGPSRPLCQGARALGHLDAAIACTGKLDCTASAVYARFFVVANSSQIIWQFYDAVLNRELPQGFAENHDTLACDINCSFYYQKDNWRVRGGRLYCYSGVRALITFTLANGGAVQTEVMAVKEADIC